MAEPEPKSTALNGRHRPKMKIAPDDEAFLLRSMMAGDVMLVLGAGASASCKNSAGEPVKMGKHLASVLATRAGLPYSEENLTDVVSAVRGQYLSDLQIREILVREYKGIIPSDEISSLFQVCWKRIYTFNYDDSIENIQKRSSQVRRYYNGIVDSAVEFEGPRFLHVIHLHGEIIKPEHGFVLSDIEYARHASSGKNFWYERCGQDYINSTPVFIGTNINEPILLAEIERAKKDGEFVSGRGYVVTPNNLTSIQTAALRSKGLVHLNGTLEDFSKWVNSAFPHGNSATEVIKKTNEFPEHALDSITASDIDVAHSLHPVSAKSLAQKARKIDESDLTMMARQFLRGFPPSWSLVAADVPVHLEAFVGLKSKIDAAIEGEGRLVVITGQAGSGKTTAAMLALFEYSRENPETPIYELARDVTSVSRAFSLLQRLNPGKCVVFVGDLFVYGDGFAESLQSIKGNLTVISSARTGEWNEHLSRYLGNLTTPIVFERFVRKDYDNLIDRLIKYVPAPRFRKMTRVQQHTELAKSKSQLLIALREATDSANFDEIITSEFQKLPDSDTRRLLLIVGIATLARTGISVEVAKDAYERLRPVRTFAKALEALDGIVSVDQQGRLVARHDLYVRHIFDEVANFSEICDAIRELLRGYVKYKMPVVKNVSRLDAQLFRFVLNHSFVDEISRRKGRDEDGSEIYSDFETEFQLDGHYWLQYGLYLAGIGRLDDAIAMMRRSISAYSGNPYAVHALADLQLRAARNRVDFDAVTRDLIDVSVKTLKVMDSQYALQTDQYPIVTLSIGHISALIRHERHDDAKKFAKEYFERIKFLARSNNSPMLERAQERLLRYVTLGDWGDAQKSVRPPPRHRSRRRR